MIKGKTTVTGVQPKLSLHIEKPDNEPEKLTIVGLWGQYILKPQSPMWEELPQIEDLTMHLAQLSRIRTAKHSLVRLDSGELAYITKRMDRNEGVKKHMEDMCQLLGRLTEDKYKSSHEQIAKEIKRSSINPGLDLVRFYELTLFSFLTGNADMHLKNFSLLKNEQGHYELAPAYDLVSSALVVEGDDEELALTLCGKKKRLRKSDFFSAMTTSGIPNKAAENILNKYSKLHNIWIDFINQSFLSEEMMGNYSQLIESKHNQLFG
ncbi:HipA domain-containing protein [Reichenbachiella carrageenanivorans]|uniref:HipA domain-containing protein n=1 Tax=Reichenbachiella carrageenanivorans TaxID=2979869 RepID=A0ABY6CZ50_9BACT|nr:HipA domain-containing protein [Reichenbachiella carrageenanivorans]UXX79199.1 HipA domain-containing protein [Reichenbachiella carrageenanivorans]